MRGCACNSDTNMKNNWNKTVNEINRKRYVIPEGWDTREVVAEQLECAPDRVADLLKPGLQSGEIERQEFSVWDEARRLTTRVVCYRVASGKPPTMPAKPEPENREYARIRAGILRNPQFEDKRIARNARSTVSVVAQVRKDMGL